MGRSMVETLIGGDELIANGREVKLTRPSINPESLLGKLVYSFSGSED